MGSHLRGGGDRESANCPAVCVPAALLRPGCRHQRPQVNQRKRVHPMSQHSATVIKEGARETPVVAETDVLVVGGGPAGVCAAIAAARSGARVVLTERYPHLGGLASGGQVIVLDDMADLHEKTVGGLSDEIVDRLDALGGAVYPPVEDRFVSSEAAWARWAAGDSRTTTPAPGLRPLRTPSPLTRRR